MPKPVNWEDPKTLEFMDFTCQCPDFTKRQRGNVNSKYESNQVGRNWSSSNAGTREGQWCKHIWATIINNGWLELVEVPKDYKTEEPQRVRKSRAAQNLSTNRGDTFF